MNKDNFIKLTFDERSNFEDAWDEASLHKSGTIWIRMQELQAVRPYHHQNCGYQEH